MPQLKASHSSNTGILQLQGAEPHTQGSDSGGLGWNPHICWEQVPIADAAGQGPHRKNCFRGWDDLIKRILKLWQLRTNILESQKHNSDTSNSELIPNVQLWTTQKNHRAGPRSLLLPAAGPEPSTEISRRILHRQTMPHPNKSQLTDVRMTWAELCGNVASQLCGCLPSPRWPCDSQQGLTLPYSPSPPSHHPSCKQTTDPKKETTALASKNLA